MTDRRPDFPHTKGREAMWSAAEPYVQVVWDSTSLSSYMQCPRRYYYEIIEGWRPKALSADLLFGKLLHDATGLYDTLRVEGKDHETALREMVRWALVHSAGGQPDSVTGEMLPPLDECDDPTKTRLTLIRCLVWWADEFGADATFPPLVMPDGKVTVELSWRLPLGIETPDGDQYIVCGHFDELVRYGDDHVMVLERKTTKSTISSYFWRRYNPSVQVWTYDLAARLYAGDSARGVLMEAFQTGKTMARVERKPIPRTKEQAEEWLGEVEQWIKRAEADARAQHWPLNTTACNNFGGCPFARVCVKSPGVRSMYLDGEFQRQFWNTMAER